MKTLKSPAIQKKLKKIKLLALDVDGVLTDCRSMWIRDQGWTRFFNIYDGYGIKLLMELGIRIAVISAGKSEDLEERMRVLGIEDFYCGKEDKLVAMQDLMKKYSLKADQIAYIADELFDLPVLEKVGFSATVPDAVEAVRKRVDYVTEKRGGYGAVREVIEGLRQAQRLGPFL